MRVRQVSPWAHTAAGLSVVLLVTGCAAEDEPVVEPSAVASVSGVGWEWEPPPERRILAVELVAMGAAVFLDTGVTVLHGGTGQEVWSHVAREGEAFAATLTEDGSSFLVAVGPDGGDRPQDTLMLDADTGDTVGQFRVQRAFAPWDLWRASQTERVHRPPGPTEAFRPLSVIDVVRGGQRWQQEESLTCEAAPGYVSRQSDILIHDPHLLVLVVCGPERFEDPLEVTTAVVALDLADGQEVWRREFTHVSATSLPAASMTAHGDAVLVAGREIPEAHVIDASDGEVVASAQRTVVGTFGAGVLAWEEVGSGDRYRLLGADLETAESVELASSSGSTFLGGADVLALKDGLVSVEVLEEDGDPAGLTLGFTPWGGAEAEVLDSALSIEAGDDFGTRSRMVEVPGAVLLMDGRSSRPTRLVAYQ